MVNLPNNFVAMDFETADFYPDSACAIGLVKVVDDKIVQRVKYLIKPPRRCFVFSYLHGITWDEVRREPTFRELWPSLRSTLNSASFIAAHNASFDSGVLRACCRSAKVRLPKYRFVCTVKLARTVLEIRPANLSHVCQTLGIELDHHNPLSDAQACAKIVMAARTAGKRAGSQGQTGRTR